MCIAQVAPNDRIQEPPIRRDIEKQSANPIKDYGENAVDGEEIGRERDPRICPIREDMSSLTADFELMHLSPEECHPKRMRELVPEDIEPLRTRQSEESHHPENYSEGKEPKFFGNPKPIPHGGARKGGKKSLR